MPPSPLALLSVLLLPELAASAALIILEATAQEVDENTKNKIIKAEIIIFKTNNFFCFFPEEKYNILGPPFYESITLFYQKNEFKIKYTP
ncbi:MAG: hypothetical protein NTV16_02785 [Actinobacteria bacterium]|nr:hypothetical protein [Actinomycetota bacterium]